MIQNSKGQKNITKSIQLLTSSCLKRVKTNEFGVESIEASARGLTLWLLFNPTSRDFRVVAVKFQLIQTITHGLRTRYFFYLKK